METLESRLPSLFIIPLIQVLVGIFLFIALLHGERGLALLALLLLGIAMAARLWSRLSLSGTRCTLLVDRGKLFPGESLTLRLRAENAKWIPVWLRVSLPSVDGLHPSPGERPLTGECGLLWHQRADFTWELVARRRGLYRVGPAKMKVADLFGFFPREKRTEGHSELVVYPRLVPLRPFLVPRTDIFGVPGAKSPVQDPIYILGTREYQPWRPARHIHWKASARYHRLQEKVFEPSEQEKLLVALEVSQFQERQAAERFERTLEVVGSLAVQSHQRGYALGFVTNGLVEGGPPLVPFGRTPQQLSSILEILARLQMKAKGSLRDALSRAMTLPWGIGCVHFSYGQDEGTLLASQYFSQRRIPAIFVVCGGPVTLEGDGLKLAGKICPLADICIEEIRKP